MRSPGPPGPAPVRPPLRSLLAAAFALLAGCGRTGSDRRGPVPPLHLTDVTAASGIDLTVTSGREPASQILEVKGGGVALVDFDADGDADIFVPDGATLDDPEHGPGSVLLENLGELRFRDVTAASGIEHRRWSFGVAVGDTDGDRLDDIYIACFGRDVLLRNLGGGRFEDVTRRAGLGAAGWSTSAAFADIDRDGDLDLYVTRFLDFDPQDPPPRATYMGVEVLAGPLGLLPENDLLYENLGDGAFRDISESSGCRRAPPSAGLNAVTLDVDADGWQDIFVANDSMANFLFRNLGGGRFEEIGVAGGVAFNADGAAQATMGIAIGDVDGNGLPDLFTTNFSSDTNTLWLDLDGRHFRDATARYGLGAASTTFVGWACGLHDLDLDGDEDLLVFNGHVYPEAASGKLDSLYRQAPLLFERRGDRFVRARPQDAGEWLGRRYRGRSAAFGDLDGDGDIDAVFTELNGPLHVLRNDAAGRAAARWLIVELDDRRPGSANHRGIGARVELEVRGRRQVRWIHGGGPFQSASAATAHFAVAPPSGEASGGRLSGTLRVAWPDGETFEREVEGWDRRLTVARGGTPPAGGAGEKR